MQIHEITKQHLTEAGLADVIYGGLAKLVGGVTGAQSPEKMAAANQQAIEAIAKKALPMWLAKKAQLDRAFTSIDDYNEELEAWTEQNLLNHRQVRTISQADPKYQAKIKELIQNVNDAQSSPQTRQESFNQLVAVAAMARPARSDAERVAGHSDVQKLIHTAEILAAAGKSGSSDLNTAGISQIAKTDVAKYAGPNAAAAEKILGQMGVALT